MNVLKLIVEHVLQFRHAEERREQAEARARELEKQVSCSSKLLIFSLQILWISLVSNLILQDIK